MKTVRGDLIELTREGHFDVIIHGCNCFHVMGAGVAKQISDTFPEALFFDKLTSKGSREKLGTVSVADIPIGHPKFYNKYDNVHIVNAYTQFNYGTKIQVNYEAVRSCFKTIKELYPNVNCRIGYPRIGAGLAGGDWNIISKIIDEELQGLNHTLVEYAV